MLNCPKWEGLYNWYNIRTYEVLPLIYFQQPIVVTLWLAYML